MGKLRVISRAVSSFFGTAHGRALGVALWAGGLVGALVAGAVPAGATCTGDAVDCGFATVQTSLTTYLGDAVALVLAIVGLAVGIRMLVRWTKRAAAS